MGTTPALAIPYIEPTDPIGNYPVSDKAQAERVEALFTTTTPAPRTFRYKSVVQALTNLSVPMTIFFDVDTGDGTGVVYGSNGVFTVPTPGVYQVNASLHFQVGAGTGQLRLIMLINGDQKLVLVGKNDVSFSLMGSSAFRLAANGTIAIQAQPTIAGCTVYGSGTRFTTVDITRIAN